MTVQALVKDRVVDAPYKKWSMSVEKPLAAGVKAPTYEKLSRVTIASQKHEIVIDVTESTCRLLKPTTKVFADLIGCDMTPGKLLYLLQRRGLNFLPTSRDIERIGSIPQPYKSPSLELGGETITFATSPAVLFFIQ